MLQRRLHGSLEISNHAVVSDSTPLGSQIPLFWGQGLLSSRAMDFLPLVSGTPLLCGQGILSSRVTDSSRVRDTSPLGSGTSVLYGPLAAEVCGECGSHSCWQLVLMILLWSTRRTLTCVVPCCWNRLPTASSTCAAPWFASLPST